VGHVTLNVHAPDSPLKFLDIVPLAYFCPVDLYPCHMTVNDVSPCDALSYSTRVCRHDSSKWLQEQLHFVYCYCQFLPNRDSNFSDPDFLGQQGAALCHGFSADGADDGVDLLNFHDCHCSVS
jgi:hypothetical protein